MEARSVAEPAVELQSIRKTFASHAAVDGIDLAVPPGEFLTLLGPSGCGKSTTLNLIAGFLQPDSGAIRLAGRSVVNLPPFRRDIGIVFQDYALFPHMTVGQNVAFGLRMRKIGRREIERRVEEALELVQLSGFLRRRPSELSGGQRQRVALARALVIRPTVLLLDEPLSNLDLKLREEMRLEITGLQHRLKITTVLVTHDQGEALAVSDRIAVMNRGRIEQIGPPLQIYEQPASRFVADFIGAMNFLRGVARISAGAGELCAVETPHGRFSALAPRALESGQDVVVAVRPEHLRLASAAAAPEPGLAFAARVFQHVYLGAHTEVHVRTEAGEHCLLEVSVREAQSGFPVNHSVRLFAPAQHLQVFGASGSPEAN